MVLQGARPFLDPFQRIRLINIRRTLPKAMPRRLGRGSQQDHASRSPGRPVRRECPGKNRYLRLLERLVSIDAYGFKLFYEKYECQFVVQQIVGLMIIEG